MDTYLLADPLQGWVRQILNTISIHTTQDGRDMFFRLVDFPLLRRLTKYVGITQAVCVVFLALTLACTGTQSQSEEGIGTAAAAGKHRRKRTACDTRRHAH